MFVCLCEWKKHCRKEPYWLKQSFSLSINLQIIFLITRFIFSSIKCQPIVRKGQVAILKCPVLSDQQFKIQRYYIYCKKSIKFSHPRSRKQLILGILVFKKRLKQVFNCPQSIFCRSTNRPITAALIASLIQVLLLILWLHKQTYSSNFPGSTDNALWTKTSEISADTADWRNASEPAWRKKVGAFLCFQSTQTGSINPIYMFLWKQKWELPI